MTNRTERPTGKYWKHMQQGKSFGWYKIKSVNTQILAQDSWDRVKKACNERSMEPKYGNVKGMDIDYRTVN